MNTDKALKITLYSLLGLGAILGATLLLGKKTDDGDQTTDDGGVTYGDEISEEQKKVPPKVVNATKNKSVAKGMKVYAKLSNIKGRSQNYVNNGFIDNIVWEGDSVGEYLGVVSNTAPDKGAMKDSNGKVYTWFKVALDPKAWNRYNDTKGFLTKQLFMSSSNNWAWFREDTLKA